MERYKRNVNLLIILSLFAECSFAEDLTLNVNFRRPISISNEKFLSLTLDPATLLHKKNALSTNFEKSTNLARALSPAYVRLGGPHSNSYKFGGRQYSQNGDIDPNFIFSESDWILAHQWAEKSGLDVIACIPPEYIKNVRQTGSHDFEDELEIISFSDRMGYNTSWQLGYECQTRCDIPASDLGKLVANLRKKLNDFPRYSNSIIAGPDVVDYRTKEQQEYLHDYLSTAAPALSAITWHPDLAAVTLDNEGVSLHRDNLEADKNDLYKIIGRFATRRPLWIAESKPEESKNLFLGALVWTRRLGNVAKLKVEVVMRQTLDVTRPTPAYWVSVLHKKLVGREVFDTKIQTGNESHVYFYSQCTKPSSNYEKGSVTIFGMNLTPKNVAVNLKGIKITVAHKYILLPGFDAPNRMFSESVLLNDEPLNMINDTFVPDMKPVILNHPKGLALELPPGGIGFWVLPDLKIKSCMEDHENSGERISLRRIQKRMANADEEEEEHTKSRKPLVKEEKKKHRDMQNNIRIARRLRKKDVKKELRRLKNFVRKELEKRNEENKPSNSRRSSSSTHDRHNEKGNTYKRSRSTDKLHESQEHSDMLIKLKEFKDRLLKIQNEGGTNGGGVSDALELISKIEDALQTSPNNKNYLQSLYSILSGKDSGESADTSESEEYTIDQGIKRYKRDLNKRLVDAPAGTRRESSLKKRSKIEDIRKIKRKEDIRREVQPSVFEHRVSDSGENTFYGFFRTSPVEGFPEGDVFLDTGDSSQNGDYDYVKDEEESKEQKTKVNHRLSTPAVNYVEAEDTWVEDENDYHNHAPNEFFETVKMPSYRAKENLKEGAELWEAEYHEQKNDKSQDVPEAEVQDRKFGETEELSGNQQNFKSFADYYDDMKNSQTDRKGNYEMSNFESRPTIRPHPVGRILTSRGDRIVDQRTRISDYGVKHLLKSADFSMGDRGDIHENKRTKRKSSGLNAIFYKEMIDEDDNNSKDCRCRVIRDFMEPSNDCYCRFKRNAQVAEEGENTFEKEILVDSTAIDSIDTPAFDSNSYIKNEEAVPVLAEENSEQQLNSDYPQELEDKTEIVATDIDTSISSENSSVSPRNTENLSSETSPVDYSTTPTLNEENTSNSFLEPLTLQDENTFFREDSAKEKEKTTIDIEVITERVSTVREDTTPSIGENYTEESIATTYEEAKGYEEVSGSEEAKKHEEISGTGNSGATFEATTLSEKIAEEPQHDYNNNKATNGTLKRHVVHDRTSAVKFVKDMIGKEPTSVEIPRLNNSRHSKQSTSRATNYSKTRKNERAEEPEKSHDARLIARARSLYALRKENDNNRKGKEIMQIPQKSVQYNNRNREYQVNREEQVDRLKKRLREKRERLLQHYHEELQDIVEKINDEENRNLKRREVWEKIKESDDFRDMIDREKLAYILMYKPINYDSAKKEESKDEKPVDKKYVPTTEIVRARNVRERTINPKNHRVYKNPIIMQHSNPYALTEKIRLKDVHENLAAQSERYSDDARGNGKSYYAIVENLNDPRIIPYQRKPHIQVPSSKLYLTRNGYIYDHDRPLYERRSNDHYEIIEDSSSEESEEDGSNELSSGRKLYAIDPSTYRGGEPTLQIHEDSSESVKTDPENLYRVVWKSVSPRNTGKGQEKREDTSYSDRQLLRILLSALKSQSTKKGYDELTKRKENLNKKEKNLVNSNAEQVMEKESQEDSIETREESSEANVTPQAVEEMESYESSPILKEIEVKEDVNFEAQENANTDGELKVNKIETDVTHTRTRRNTDNLKRLPTFLVRKAPRENKKPGRKNYVCLKQDSTEESDEDRSKLFKLVKENGYYEAVPIENLSIEAPNRYSSIKLYKDSIGNSKNSYSRHQLRDYKDTSSSVEEASEIEKADDYSDKSSPESVEGNNSETLESQSADEKENGKGSDEINEPIDLKAILVLNDPEVLKLLPLNQKFIRLRRHLTDHDKIDENQNTDEVQSFEALEEFSPTFLTSNNINDVEESIAKKKTTNKHFEKKNLLKHHITKKKNLESSSSEDNGLPSLIQGTIPKLENVIVGGIEKAQNLTDSVEQLIENIDDKFNETSKTDTERDLIDHGSISATHNVLNSAITNIKKFFSFLGGITRIFRG